MYLIIETDTTGLPINFKAPISNSDNWPRLCRIGFILLDENGNVMREGVYLVNPSTEIPFNATRIHGVSTEMVQKYGNSTEEVLQVLQTVAKKAKYLIGHNLEFRYKVISAEIFRYKAHFSLKRKIKICTMDSSKEFYNQIMINGKYKPPKLTELYQKLFDEEYLCDTFIEDLRATAKCFWELKNRGVIKI